MKGNVVFYTDEKNYYCYSFWDDCIYVGKNTKGPKTNIVYLLAVCLLPSVCRSVDNIFYSYYEKGSSILIAILSLFLGLIAAFIVFSVVERKRIKNEKKISVDNEDFYYMLEKGYQQYRANLYLVVALLIVNTFLFIYLSFSFAAIIFFSLTILSMVTIILIRWVNPLLKWKLYKKKKLL